MIESGEISEKSWLKLYNAATAFRDLHPWEWMYDSDIFGVKDPQTGETGFCCVMGNLREVFALAVYPGDKGLKSYLRLAGCGEAPEDTDIPLEQDCLMASFEDKEYLSKEDREIIKELGLEFNGKSAWPLFRRYSPGRVPWFLNSAEVEYLTLVLEQANIACQRFKADKKMLRTNRPNTYFVRVAQVTNQETLWRDEWIPLANPTEEKAHLNLFLNGDRLEEIKKQMPRRESVWEMDLFYSPFSISEKTPPYFPKIFLCCEQSSGYVLGHHLFTPENYQESLADYFLDFIETVGFLPSVIKVKKDEVHNLFCYLLSNLGVIIERTGNLAAVQEARKALSTFSKRKKIGRNDPCPCGSGKKYKKCCLGKDGLG